MKRISDEKCLLVDFVKCKKKAWERVSSKVSVSLCWALLQVFDRNISPSVQGVWPFPPRPSKTNRATPMTQPCTWTPRQPTIAQTLTDYGSLKQPQAESHPLLCECIQAMPFLHNCRRVATAWCNSAEALRQEVCLFHDTESNPWNDNYQHNPVCVSWCHGRWECLPITQSCEFDALIPQTCVHCKTTLPVPTSLVFSQCHTFTPLSVFLSRLGQNKP